MNAKMKNISQSEVLVLKEQISYQEGQVVSKTLAQNNAVSITLFSFAKGEEISTHASGGDAFVTCLDGVGKITIDGVDYLLHEGESIVMPAGHPHAVYGEQAFNRLSGREGRGGDGARGKKRFILKKDSKNPAGPRPHRIFCCSVQGRGPASSIQGRSPCKPFLRGFFLSCQKETPQTPKRKPLWCLSQPKAGFHQTFRYRKVPIPNGE